MPTIEIPVTDTHALVGGSLPLTTDRDRRRAAITAPKLDPGRYLAIEDGDEVVVIEIADAALRLGRSAAADVMLEHLSVSRRHAVVVLRDEEVAILDDRSLNGVLVNGERVREATLQHGDEVRLGEVAMRYLHVT
jgi:pSer/pThr/pTyr-binding forkhead associated (FHA) protein